MKAKTELTGHRKVLESKTIVSAANPADSIRSGYLGSTLHRWRRI